jgi:hypothetical protein
MVYRKVAHTTMSLPLWCTRSFLSKNWAEILAKLQVTDEAWKADWPHESATLELLNELLRDMDTAISSA